MGRKERRAMERANRQTLKSAEQMSRDEKKAKLFRNGITDADLKENWELGFQAGVHATYSMVFAAALLSLSELFGFGQERCFRFMQRVYQHIEFTLDNTELVQKVYDRTGLEIVLDDALEPVIKKEPKKKKRERISDGFGKQELRA